MAQTTFSWCFSLRSGVLIDRSIVTLLFFHFHLQETTVSGAPTSEAIPTLDPNAGPGDHPPASREQPAWRTLFGGC